MHKYSALFATIALPALLIASGACGQSASAVQGDRAAEPEQVEEIIVTGSRIARDGFNSPTPTTVLSADAIQARGLSNIGDVLNEVPSFRNSASPQTAVNATFGTGATYADLRALGGIRTLTLVDGRRHVPSAATGQVDLNLIPTLLVERVDVVTGGASAAYGSDAVSGVVNLILDKRLDGFRGDVSYGVTEQGDNEEYRLSLAFGTGFQEGRGHIIIGGEYVDSSGVASIHDRDWGRMQSGLVSYVGTRAADQPSRFYGNGVQFTNLAYGGLIIGVNADTNTANGADVLRGITFGPGGVIEPFNYGNTIGTVATNFTGGDAGLFAQDGFPIVTPIERRSVFSHIDYDLTSAISVFVEGGYGRSGTKSQSPPVRDTSTTAIVIRRDNAFLPAGIASVMDANGITSFSMGRANNDFGPVSTDNNNTTERFSVGFNADLGHDWKLDGYYQYGENRFASQVSNLRIESNFAYAVDAVRVGGNIVCRNAATAPSGCVPINLFGEGSPSAAAIDYVTGTIFYNIKTAQRVGAVNLQGTPLSTWAGPVSIAFGAEYRKETAVATSDDISQHNGFNYSNPKPFSGGYDVKEVYGEAIVPLAKDSVIGQSLELNAAVRYTDYSTTGGVTTWKVGATYEPISDILFRATRSRDIRAPNNSELYQQTSTLSQLRNPFSGATGQIPTFNLASGSLQPEVADTTTAGVVLKPRFIPGLSLSADYWDIKIDGAISSFGGQSVLDNCFTESQTSATPYFCTFVNRSGTGAATVINSLSLQLLNIASLKARGVDLEAAYRFQLGRGDVAVRLFGTYTQDLISDDGQGVPRTYNAAGVIQNVGSVVDRAGQVGGFTNGLQNGATSAPKWVLNSSLSYALDRFTGTVQGRYVGGGNLDHTLVGPDSPDYNPASPISIADNTVSGRFYVNLSLQYDVIKDGGRKMQIYGLVNNLTDKDPPSPRVAIAGLYDRAGRSYKAGVRFTY